MTVVIGVLVLGTYHPIWIGLNEEFPTITGEAALSTIIEVGTLAACAIALYVFLLRPRGKVWFSSATCPVDSVWCNSNGGRICLGRNRASMAIQAELGRRRSTNRRASLGIARN